MKPLTAALILTVTASSVMAANERAWNEYICEQMGGQTEVKTPVNTRVDCLTPTHACEADWNDKHYQAVGQAMHYAVQMNRKPCVIFLCRGNDRECHQHWLMMRESVSHHMGLDRWLMIDVDVRGEPGE